MDDKQSPKPPPVVGGWGSPPIPPLNRAIAGRINYEYRPDFPENSRTPVLAAQIRAARDFNDKRDRVGSERELRAMRFACAMRPTLAFAHEAIREMRLRWGLTFIDSLVRDFVKVAMVWAGLPSDTEFETSDEWKQYETELLEVSQLQSGPSVPEDTHATIVKPATDAIERKALIAAYKSEGAKRGILITDLMIARAASQSWHDRTPVQRWKQGDKRCTEADDARIRKVLREKPHLK